MSSRGILRPFAGTPQRRLMIHKKYLQNALVGGVAVLFGGTRLIPNPGVDGPAATTAIALVSGSAAKDTMR